nr:hypothetical protein GCM10017611_82580 [Rhodococcus wratislaviensis]
MPTYRPLLHTQTHPDWISESVHSGLVSTMVIVRAVRNALPNIPLVASGGFADGAGLAAALSLGADAAQFGTRFIASHESNVAPAYRQRIVDATIDDTDVVGRDLGAIRMLSNDFSKRMLELEHGGAPLDDRKSTFLASTLKDAALHGDTIDGKVEAGQSAGLINSIERAADIVDSIVAEYLYVVAHLPAADRATVRLR